MHEYRIRIQAHGYDDTWCVQARNMASATVKAAKLFHRQYGNGNWSYVQINLSEES